MDLVPCILGWLYGLTTTAGLYLIYKVYTLFYKK